MVVLKFVLVGLAGWLNQSQQWVIEYLQEECSILIIEKQLEMVVIEFSDTTG
jgi:hypothetical protein